MYRNYDGWCSIISPVFRPSFGLGLESFGHNFGGFYLSFCICLGDYDDLQSNSIN